MSAERKHTVKDTSFCRGCRDDYYNGQGAAQCWSLESAQVVRRWRIGWWTRPTEAGAYTEVETYDCHQEPGQYAFHKELPVFTVEPVRLQRAAIDAAMKSGAADA